ncbi:chorismate mutase [Streptomyces sp. NPDC046831]|uniref:chorismate mutase n=1 Tax=Streptomyces sp. NPDC046831 TaxID=3154805 RepID=UPI0033D1EDF5
MDAEHTETSPDSWRRLPAAQQPHWPDPEALRDVVAELSACPPLVFAGECDQLRGRLAQAARGEAFVLQGGDCAETFAAVTAGAPPRTHSRRASRRGGVGRGPAADVPLMCAQELDIEAALPRVVRILAHADTERPKPEIQHVYLGGAAALRRDLAAAAGSAG